MKTHCLTPTCFMSDTTSMQSFLLPLLALGFVLIIVRIIWVLVTSASGSHTPVYTHLYHNRISAKGHTLTYFFIVVNCIYGSVLDNTAQDCKPKAICCRTRILYSSWKLNGEHNSFRDASCHSVDSWFAEYEYRWPGLWPRSHKIVCGHGYIWLSPRLLRTRVWQK